VASRSSIRVASPPSRTSARSTWRAAATTGCRTTTRILDFTKLADAEGHLVKAGTDGAREDVVSGTRRTTLASRLKTVYGAGNVDKVDAFVGMVSERHVRGTEFGPLQLAIWKKQFEALRDGDRFFHGNDPALRVIRAKYGIDHRRTLGDLIAANTDVPRGDLAYNVFRTHPPVG
jgi:hypothetical protein